MKDREKDTAPPGGAADSPTPNRDITPLVAAETQKEIGAAGGAFAPDPAESFEAMVKRLTGSDLNALREPGATLLENPPYPMPAAGIALQLARLYPGRVRIRYGAPASYYRIGEQLTLHYVDADPGFPPLPEETAAEYLTRHLRETGLPGGSTWLVNCAGRGFTVADARALQAQDPEGVLIGFGGLTGRYVLKIRGRACFMFPEAEDDDRGADIPFNGGEAQP